jgi:hypothetical protein
VTTGSALRTSSRPQPLNRPVGSPGCRRAS